MDPALQSMLGLLEGPVFRFAFALMVLGYLRSILLRASDAVGGYVVSLDRAAYWRRFRLRLAWRVFPALVVPELRRNGFRVSFRYQLFLSSLSLIFRTGMVFVPMFMVAHVYLWERGWGFAWPSLPGTVADVWAVVTIVSGLALLLGQLYSPFRRKVEPAWTFSRPLILLAPLFTGILAMHPTWSPIDYYVMMVLHTSTAALAFVLAPFAGLLDDMHTRLPRLIPSAEWVRPDELEAAARAREALGAIFP